VTIIAPTDFRDYAKSLGWSVLPEALPDRLIVLTHAQFSGRQIIIPLDATAPDYQESIDRAVVKLATLYNWTISELVESIHAAKEDSVRYRIVADQRVDRSIPLLFGSSIIQAAQQILLSASCTALNPRTYHPRLYRADAQKLLDQTRFGHTEQKSFVLKITCPVNALDTQHSLPGIDASTSFVRMVNLITKHSLHRLISAIELDRLTDLVDDLKKEPQPVISSNFCEALTMLYDDTLRNRAEISFRWAITHPKSPSDTSCDTVAIQSDYFARIDEVKTALHSGIQEQPGLYIGTVERLDGEIGEDGRRSGDALMSLLLDDGNVVKVKVTLTADQYAIADSAHMAGRAYVRVRGKLYPGRQPRLLSDISEFAHMSK
jgi:uncharacterized protein YifN (PemK superfamily)